MDENELPPDWAEILRQCINARVVVLQIDPQPYWHHDEDFAAFMDAVLEPVELGDDR